MTVDWIDTDTDLLRLVDRLESQPIIAIDTEFHRERTFFPRLALIQLGWQVADGFHIALVDPLACRTESLTTLFTPGREFLFHACQQDLDVLAHSLGSVPSTIFDTQLAAGFLGYSTPSLANLINAELRVSLPKGDRLTDWLRRPLSDAQRRYAAADVEYLFDLRASLVDKLTAKGRLDWAIEACGEMLTKKMGPSDPSEAWMRLKDVRAMKARTRGVLAALAEWRERRAMAADIPPRQVLADLALHGIAQREPGTLEELGQARGVDERHIRGAFGQEILEAVRQGRQAPVEMPEPEGEDLERHLRPAVTLVSAWVSEVARREQIDPMLLATRSDIVDFLRRRPGNRLAEGWRWQTVGSQLDRLVDGRSGLAFDGRGGLRLIEVPEPSPKL
ncbi:MAG: putative ribonuclease [Actinomycetota bacterium]